MKRKTILQYSDRDYQTALLRLNEDPVLRDHLPHFLKNALCGFFDALNNQLNAVANTLFVDSLYARDYAQNLFNLLDYRLGGKNPSSAILRFEVDPAVTATGDYLITRSNLAASSLGTLLKPSVRFEARSDLTILQGEIYGEITCWSQETRTPQATERTTGESFQKVDLPDFDVIKDTLSVSIGGENYQRRDTFVDSTGLSRHYILNYRSDGSGYITLGGTNELDETQFGYVPPADLDVEFSYAVGGGIDSNVNDTDEITSYLGNDFNVLGVTNITPAAGGSDAETMENARSIAPIFLRSIGFFSNISTGIALVKKSVEEVLVLQIVDRITIVDPGFLVDVYVIPVGGGLPTQILKDEIQELLVESSPLEQISVDVYDPGYVDVAVSAEIAVYAGYSYANIVKYVELALALRSSEISSGIYETYYSTGISDAVTRINNDFYDLIPYLTGGGSYGATDASQIRRLLDNLPYQNFAENLNPEDLIGAVQGFVDGVDLCRITAPSAPVEIENGQISRPTSISTSQVTE